MYELKNVHHFTPQDMDRSGSVFLLCNNHWFEQHQAFRMFVHQCLMLVIALVRNMTPLDHCL